MPRTTGVWYAEVWHSGDTDSGHAYTFNECYSAFQAMRQLMATLTREEISFDSVTYVQIQSTPTSAHV